jgi:hypothetical protein
VGGSPLYAAKLSPDGTMIALSVRAPSLSHSPGYILCQAATGENLLSVTNPDLLTADCFLPDGRTWVFANGPNINLWDLHSRRITHSLHCDKKILTLSVAPDGKFLAASRTDDLISLWDLDSKVELGKLSGHQAHVWSLAFSPDGRTLASGGEDRAVKFWDLATRREIASILQKTAVYWLSFSPDNQMLVSGGIGSYHFWPAPRGGVALPLAAPRLSLADLPTNSVWRIPDGARPLPRRMLAEKEECFTNMLKLHAAILAYRKDHEQMPDWLSDLVPQYLSDTNCLICPDQARTGTSPDLLGMEDPRIKTSYSYEFSARANTFSDLFGIAAPGDTMKEWKIKQLAHFGKLVPVVRCLFHGEVLSVTYAGERLQGAGRWELAAEAKLRKSHPAESGKWLVKMETEGRAPALNELAWVMAVSRNAEERDGPGAVRLAEKAAALTNRKDGATLDTLAAAYAETGQFDKAVSVENEAIALETAAVLKKAYEVHLKLYQSHAPCREPAQGNE